MLLHSLKYELLTALRERSIIIWLVIFPIGLGIFMNAAFGSLYEKTTNMSALPVAIVEEQKDPVFRSVVESLEDSDEPFLKAEYTDRETAEKLLSDGDVKGIIMIGDPIVLEVKESGIEQTILRSFTDQYTVNSSIIREIMKKDPEMAMEAGKRMADELNACHEVSLTNGNTDSFTQYFYNLIAMVAMYGSILGLQISVNNQANLSDIGARKGCSPVRKSITLTAGLISAWIIESGCMAISVTFLRFVLGVELGGSLGLVYLTALLGGIAGVSIGFMIGSFDRFKYEVKFGIAMAVSMTLCFLSGLMMGTIKHIIEKKAPIINRLNPAALISDCLYALNVDSDLHRFSVKIASLAVMTLVFSVIGLIMMRRKKYASI